MLVHQRVNHHVTLEFLPETQESSHRATLPEDLLTLGQGQEGLHVGETQLLGTVFWPCACLKDMGL